MVICCPAAEPVSAPTVVIEPLCSKSWSCFASGASRQNTSRNRASPPAEDYLRITIFICERNAPWLWPLGSVTDLLCSNFWVTALAAAPLISRHSVPATFLTFVQRNAGRLRGKRVHLVTAALRSFLQFARYRGQITLDLAACVPTVASWSLSTLPKSLPPAQVEQVLACCNQQSPLGKRDYAILLLLARLGLRAGEVARLTLEDLDWESGCITVHGKMGRVDQLPLPTDVGTAIAAYLKDGRPHQSGTRRLFLRFAAPLCGFAGQKAVGSVVKRALAKAGIDSPRKGAHQFRHTLASELLRKGHSLSEIGEILRHRSPDTTAIYAKVDLRSLRSLALRWPGGER